MHEVERELRRLVRAGLPGAFVFIEDADGSSQFLTAGWADLEGETRMTPESHYRVGSTTKTFTAVVALQLVSEGRLGLEDSLEELVPDIAERDVFVCGGGLALSVYTVFWARPPAGIAALRT